MWVQGRLGIPDHNRVPAVKSVRDDPVTVGSVIGAARSVDRGALVDSIGALHYSNAFFRERLPHCHLVGIY